MSYKVKDGNSFNPSNIQKFSNNKLPTKKETEIKERSTVQNRHIYVDTAEFEEEIQSKEADIEQVNSGN